MPLTPATPRGVDTAGLVQLLDLPTAAAVEDVVSGALDEARARRDLVEADTWRTRRGQFRVRRGHLDDGLADLELVVLRASVAGVTPDAQVHAGLVDGYLARGELWRAQASTTPLTRALATRAAPGPDLRRAAVLHALGDLARADQDHAAAWRHFLASGEALGVLADHPALTPWRLEAAVSAVHLGLMADAVALVDEHLGLALADARPAVVVRALRVRAAVVPHTERLALLEESVRLADPEDAPRLAALVMVDLAAHLLLTGGEARRVGQLLDRAEQIARRFGIATAAHRIVAMRAVSGETRPPPTPARGERLSGVTRLVASMASEGADDDQIAEQLDLPAGVVRREVADACRVLGIRSRRRIGEAMTLPPVPAPRRRSRGAAASRPAGTDAGSQPAGSDT